MTEPKVTLDGVNGGNPLGFLAAIGTIAVLSEKYPNASMHWQKSGRSWIPVLLGCGDDRQRIIQDLYVGLKTDTVVFDVSDMLPFSSEVFAEALHNVGSKATVSNRRDVDLLAALGTEMYPDTKGQFQTSRFRMVRSIDKLPCRIKYNIQHLEIKHLTSTLFCQWNNDEGCKPLRLDPIANKKHALTGTKPLRSNKGMLAANCLAVEALRMFPVALVGRRAQTAGFLKRSDRELYFVWPIWTLPVGLRVIRSILVLRFDRINSLKMGIDQIYQSKRLTVGYYGNFEPARPA